MLPVRRKGISVFLRWTIVCTGTLLTGVAWLLVLMFSDANLLEGLILVLTQMVLASVALTMVLFFGQGSFGTGPVVSQIIAIHALIYYGFSNVMPALLLPFRMRLAPATIFRIPPAPVLAYAEATVAAIIFLVGFQLGSAIARRIMPVRMPRSLHIGQRYAWLPNYRYALIAAVFVFAIFAYGTVRYGLSFATTLNSDLFVTTSDNDQIAKFSLGEQLLFHGLLSFLPVAPVLATSAYIQAATAQQRRLARNLMIMIVLGVLGGMLAWRMRSMALIAGILPIVLLMYTGFIKRWRVVAISGILAIFIYGTVTSVRNNLESQLAGNATFSNPLAVLTTVDVSAITSRALFDFSYRTAGLEGVAAILDYQNRGIVELQLGKVIAAGFTQALPAAMRSEFRSPYILKFAPSYLGMFLNGDWVSTFLAELTIDFGVVWLFFAAILGGLFVCGIDMLLLRLGQGPTLQGLLVLRIPFLLYPLITASSFANMTLLYFKATAGYLALLLLISLLARMRMRIGASGQLKRV